MKVTATTDIAFEGHWVVVSLEEQDSQTDKRNGIFIWYLEVLSDMISNDLEIAYFFDP